MTQLFPPKEYVSVYTLAYSLCTQVREAFGSFVVSSAVLPSSHIYTCIHTHPTNAQRMPHNQSDKLYEKHGEVRTCFTCIYVNGSIHTTLLAYASIHPFTHPLPTQHTNQPFIPPRSSLGT